MNIEDQYHEWKCAKQAYKSILNLDPATLKSSCAAVFQYNLKYTTTPFVQALANAIQNEPYNVPCFAALVAVINSQLPLVGQRIMQCMLLRFKTLVQTKNASHLLDFFACLVNQKALHELTFLQCTLLAISQGQEVTLPLQRCGLHLQKVSAPSLRYILSKLNIKSLDYESQPPELDLVPDEFKQEHKIDLRDAIAPERGFGKYSDYQALENDFQQTRALILGLSLEESIKESKKDETKKTQEMIEVMDYKTTEMRKHVYLVLMGSLSTDEAAHKLLGLPAAATHKHDVFNVVVECASRNKSYNRLFGNVACRIAGVSREWQRVVHEAFQEWYSFVHRYSTTQIRNVGTMFGHILSADAIDFSVFECVSLTPEESTPSNRIFLQSLFDELRQELGLKQLTARLEQKNLEASLKGIFSHESKENLRFAINFFTAIKLPSLTNAMRSQLQYLE